MASKQLSRLLRRDGSLCGVHHGGCGQRINAKKEGSVDHIFPQAFFRQRETGVKRAQFNENWNCQPMHKKCNNVRKGQVWGFPVFLCTCHWLQVEPNDAGGFRLCVYWQCESQAVPSRHEVDPACDFVFPDPPVEERDLEVGKNIGAFIGGSGTMGIAKQGITGEGCQWRSKKGPPRRCKKGPLGGCGLVPVVHGRAPRATRRALNRLTRRRAREGPVGPRGQAWAGWSVQLAVGV